MGTVDVSICSIREYWKFYQNYCKTKVLLTKFLLIAGLVYIDPNDPRKIPTLFGIYALHAACGYAEYPDVFTRVTKILDWIESKTRKYGKKLL